MCENKVSEVGDARAADPLPSRHHPSPSVTPHYTVLLPTLHPPPPPPQRARQTTCVLLINLRHSRSFYHAFPYYQAKRANERSWLYEFPHLMTPNLENVYARSSEFLQKFIINQKYFSKNIQRHTFDTKCNATWV